MADRDPAKTPAWRTCEQCGAKLTNIKRRFCEACRPSPDGHREPFPAAVAMKANDRRALNYRRSVGD